MTGRPRYPFWWVLAVVASIVAAGWLAGTPPAGAAPTCTTIDLSTRVGYHCSDAPRSGVTPGHSCGAWQINPANPFEKWTQCRPPTY
jgi:hypothetical protein